jgi:uncharacterized protein (DUF983 family)
VIEWLDRIFGRDAWCPNCQRFTAYQWFHPNRCRECGHANPVRMRPPEGAKGWTLAILGGLAFGLVLVGMMMALERIFRGAFLP